MENNFDAYDCACDKFSETLNFMTDDEISELELCENESEVIEYMSPFHERT